MTRWLTHSGAGPLRTGLLGPLEWRVLEALWGAAAPASVRDLTPEFPEIAYTTLMTTLDRLYRKGVLERVKQGRAFFYQTKLSRSEFDSARAVNLARAGPPRRAPVDRRPQPGPRARMEMLVDSAGLLWIARAIPAPSWDTIAISVRFDSPDEAPNEYTIAREDEDRIHNTIVEVIDPQRAELLARVQLPFLAMLARPGYVARVTADDDGLFRTMVYRVTLGRIR